MMEETEFIELIGRWDVYGMSPQRSIRPDGVPVVQGQFWTTGQRGSHSFHEFSYRACFKAELPRFFIVQLTRPGQFVYDPYMGRGTTLLEAKLGGRIPVGVDANPLCQMIVRPRLNPPLLPDLLRAIDQLDISYDGPLPEPLLTFYEKNTLREICGLRSHWTDTPAALLGRPDDPACAARVTSRSSEIDQRCLGMIRMLALSRLAGHSAGFLSVRTLPPNQSVTIEAQRRLNAIHGQVPVYRDLKKILSKKAKTLYRDPLPDWYDDPFRGYTGYIGDDPATSIVHPDGRDCPVQLTVTSPPFLDVVDYARENWLRCWFAGIDPARVNLPNWPDPAAWQRAQTDVLRSVLAMTRPGGWCAFEVGEVRRGRAMIDLVDWVIPAAVEAGWKPVVVMINGGRFTKSSHIYGVQNGQLGTNTNRIVLLRKV